MSDPVVAVLMLGLFIFMEETPPNSRRRIGVYRSACRNGEPK